MLRVARQLERAFPVRIRTTLLAAHTVPPEFSGRADEYVDTVASSWLPQLHAAGLVDAVDVFCEGIGFDLSQSERLLRAAQQLGVPVKMHAEQLSNTCGGPARGQLGCAGGRRRRRWPQRACMRLGPGGWKNPWVLCSPGDWPISSSGTSGRSRN